VPPTEPTDYEYASALYQGCRRRGEKVPKLIDCLNAASAVRESIPILHADIDFNVLARHTSLRVEQL
jgi:hypothetical protein